MTTQTQSRKKPGHAAPLLKKFSPPGLLTDLTTPVALAGWSETISRYFDSAEARVDAFLHGQPRQFFNPTRDVIDAPDSAELPILWQGFPKSIERRYGANTLKAWRAAEKIAGTHVARYQYQDEYLEWHVTRDSHTRKIVRVDFTCEGPEYWQFLAETDPELVVALYQRHVSPKVKKSDLFTNDHYNPLNAWNVAHGAMHLIQPANSLSAEIFLAADATIVRHDAQGHPITDANALIECAGYGAPERASDPHIGDLVNGLSRQGYSVTLKDPIGLYMDSLDVSNWRKPDGTPVGDYFRTTRGAKGHTVRAVYEVPAGETSAGKPFVVGDIEIGGEKIRYGGQIAKHITMRLTGLAVGKGLIKSRSFACGEPPAAASPHAHKADPHAEHGEHVTRGR